MLTTVHYQTTHYPTKSSTLSRIAIKKTTLVVGLLLHDLLPSKMTSYEHKILVNKKLQYREPKVKTIRIYIQLTPSAASRMRVVYVKTGRQRGANSQTNHVTCSCKPEKMQLHSTLLKK